MASGHGLRKRRSNCGKSGGIETDTILRTGSTPRPSRWKNFMKLASEATAGLWVPLIPSLDALLARLESLSSEPGLAAQRQIASRLTLQPYLEGPIGRLLSPLPQETELADLFFYAD